MSDDALCGRIDARLRTLHLPGVLQCYRELAAELALDGRSLQLLDGCLQAELESRELHRYQRNLKAARLPVVKELGSFDFTAIPSVSKAQVEELASGRFVAAHETVLIVGNPGTGKSHTLIGLGMAVIRAGYRVRFVTAAALVNELMLARQEFQVPKLLKQYAAYDLVLVDELGYLPINEQGAQLLFTFFGDRYETRSTALTTNLPFAQWTRIFGDETLTVALLDRLTHRSHVLLFNGESYRRRESRRRAAGAGPSEPATSTGGGH